MIKIGLIDDHITVVEGLKTILKKSFNIVFTETVPQNSFELIKQFKPDVLIVDIIFPKTNYVEYYHELRKTFPNIRIISYSSLSNPILNQSLKKMGVFEFINKNEPLEKLEQTILRSMRTGNQDIESSKTPLHLTPAEVEIVQQLAQGKTTKMIGNDLSRSHRTIENHRSNLLIKLEVNNVSQLISKCYQIGILN
ncbi:MAG: response regulator transcription factor [Flavobacteriales bacterium]